MSALPKHQTRAFILQSFMKNQNDESDISNCKADRELVAVQGTSVVTTKKGRNRGQRSGCFFCLFSIFVLKKSVVSRGFCRSRQFCLKVN